jgi:GPH family glycoside/pentoside/hexuronide:cation symporter
MAGTILAILVMRNYDVTEETANEVRKKLDLRKKSLEKKPTPYSQLDKLLSLANIQLNGGLSSDVDFSTKSNDEIKEMFGKFLNQGLHGICFSPYLEGQDIGDILSEAQIRKRMEVVSPYTKWVRSFSCTAGNEWIPKVAREKGLKTMVGAWIGNDHAENEKEINALIDLAKGGYVDIAAVGNEVLLRNELSEHEMLGYIQRVKEAIPGIPVGYVDAYFQFVERPNLVEACDLILANCYPFWEGCNIDQASQYLKQMHAVTEQAANGKPVVVTETGWPNEGSNMNGAEPSPNNAMKYFINSIRWQHEKEIEIFYFSSFDESWKVHHEGDVGERWGIWDKYENLKYK